MTIKLDERKHFDWNNHGIIKPEGEAILKAELQAIKDAITETLPPASKGLLSTKDALEQLEYSAGRLAERQRLSDITELEQLEELEEIEDLPGEVDEQNAQIKETNSTILSINTRIVALNEAMDLYNEVFRANTDDRSLALRQTAIQTWQAAATQRVPSEKPSPEAVGAGVARVLEV